jgi:hypothetical protein
LSCWSLYRRCPDLSFRWYPHLYLMFVKYSKIYHCDENYPSTKSNSSFWKCEQVTVFQLYFPFGVQGLPFIYVLKAELLSWMNYEPSRV